MNHQRLNRNLARRGRVCIVLLSTVLAAACGGGGGSGEGGQSGSLGFRVEWQRAGARGFDTSNPVPPSVDTVRLVYNGPGLACCVGIPRTERELILEGLTTGDATIELAGFPGGAVPREANPATICPVRRHLGGGSAGAQVGAACQAGLQVSASYDSDPLAVRVDSGLNDQPVITLFPVPFAVSRNPGPGDVHLTNTALMLNVAEAGNGVDCDEISLQLDGSPLDFDGTPCSDRSGGRGPADPPLCSSGGTRDVVGCQIAAIAPNEDRISAALNVDVQRDDGADANFSYSFDLLRAGDACTVDFSVQGTDLLGALQYDIDYTGLDGEFDTAATGGPTVPDCSSPVPNSEFNDNRATMVVTGGFIDFEGVQAPTLIASCELTVSPGVRPTADDFVVTVADAAAPDESPIDPKPNVVVSDIVCPDISSSTTTTTESTTTTTTTESTATTTSTSVTTTSTTTSTTVPPNFQCNITFHLLPDISYGSVQWDTDYSAAPGNFLGSGSGVECASLVSGALTEFNDKDAQELLSTAIIHLTGFDGGVDVSECTFRAFVEPLVDDFAITVVDAADPSVTPIVPLPDVTISALNCQPLNSTTTTIVIDTTTSTTSTTTMAPPTTTTTLPPSDNYVITFSVPETLSAIGAVQFNVDYSDAGGGFALAANNVDPNCQATGNVGGFGAFSDTPGTTTLAAGVISLAGFNAPASVATCVFETSGSAPLPSEFSTTVTDASFSNLDPISPLPTIGVAVAPAP